jgi:hypothetical protein
MLKLLPLVVSAFLGTFSTRVLSNSFNYEHYPRSYKAPKCSSSSFIDKIDGDITKAEWISAPWSEEFGDIRGGQDASPSSHPPPSCNTRVKMMWDEKYLYVAALIKSYNRTVETSFIERNSFMYKKDSTFEVFVDAAGCCHNYKQLELNGYNTVWNLLLDKPYNDGGTEHSGKVASDPSDSKYWEATKQRTATKLLWGEWNDPKGAVWSLEISLAHSDSLSKYSPLMQHKLKPREGQKWRINFNRSEGKGDTNWSWSPQIVWVPSTGRFEGIGSTHLPDAWGFVHFSESAEGRRIEDELFPLRLAATNIYYAQAFYLRKESKYASNIQELLPYVDNTTLSPFEVNIFINDGASQYKAEIYGSDTLHQASITSDRLLSTDWDADLLFS